MSGVPIHGVGPLCARDLAMGKTQLAPTHVALTVECGQRW
jgi:hypothetical protein